MEKTALLIIDAQQEYFAPIGKLVLPDGPPAIARIAQALDWARRRQVPVFHCPGPSRTRGSKRSFARAAWSASSSRAS
jgi:nicotinamidase-related amidase